MKKHNRVRTQITWPKCQKNWKFKMADGRHFENGFIAISRPESSDFDEIWCADSFWFKNGHMLIYKKYEIQKWRTAAILEIVFWLSPRVIVRLTRYLVRTSRTMLRHATWRKIAIFENSRWRTAAILKMISSLYLSRESSDFNEILCATADFGSKDGHMTKYRNFANSKWRTAAILKTVFGYISTI